MKAKRNLFQTCLLGAVLMGLPAVVQAQTYTNSYGIWNYANTGNGTCAITGYTGSGGAVTIPSTINNLTVAGIGNGALFGVFFENTTLTSVTIPNSVTTISDGTFADCTSLTNVTIGTNVTSVGDGSSGEGVFQGCSSLASITIPNSVTNIWTQTFLECSGLTNAVIGNGVLSIGDSAFFDCNSLASVKIGNSVMNIGDSAFLQCYPLTSVTIPNSVITIGNNAFFYCESMTNVTFGTNVTSIGGWAFEQCYSLTSVTIPSSVTNIEYGAFLSCVNLMSVYFTGNAPSLGGSVFAYDNILSAFYYLPGTSGWSSPFYGVNAFMLNPPNPAGSLQVNNVPDGAQWQVDGGLPQPGGATVLGLTVGNHTVSFGTINGWTTPSNQIVFVVANLATVVSATYVSQPPLQVTTTELDDGMVGVAYDQQISAFYGQTPYSWSLVSGSLPPGLTLGTVGMISGTPTKNGTFNFTVQVTDAFSETATQALSMTIQNPVIVTFPVSESWSVTLTLGTGTGLSTQTYTGTETGTLTVTNWNYQLINHTGYPVSGGMNLSRSIVYSYGDYEVDGSECGFGGVGGEFYAIIPLNFILIKIPIGSESGFSSGWAAYSYSYSATGTSLSSYSGSGAYVDNDYPDDDLGYVNEVDWSSTSSMTLPAPPTCQVTMPTSGLQVSNASLTITGTASGGAGVASVWYQLDGTGWNLANTTDNWTNWSAIVTLTPGTNMLQVYAMDNLGDASATKTVTFKYVVSAPLTVQLTGRGTVTPDYSNAVLQVGTTYSMTAAAVAGSGFAFTNWTGGTNLPLVLVTNGATIQFLMVSNLMLQANFVDTNKPVITITNVTSGMLVSNAGFVVIGTATDNVAVAEIYCSLSNAVGNTGFAPAMTANNWSNWRTNETLAPGTNTIRAYAVDTSGNISATNTVNLVYVVSAILTVSSNGLGSLNPNYNQALLQVGKNYAITATPGTGFMFTNWTGGTNLPLSFLTNGPTVRFLMVSNLMLQATFLDTNKPTLSITNLVSGQRVSNAVFTVKGTAGDNWQISNVLCQINGGVWNSATNINNWTNWSAGVMLVPGTNTVAAYAVDTSGNISTTNSVTFQFVVTNQLGVRAIGLGTILPNYSNAWLEIGRNYSITSAPASGFVFTNWMVSTNWLGGATVTSTNLQFMMQSNLTLQASFVETNKPTLTITAPTAGQHMTNAMATVTGTTSDKWGVTGVWYQLNNGAWNASATTNGWTNWTTTVELISGTNTVKAYAMNLGGNVSTNSSVSMVSSNSFKLQLTFAAGQPLAGNGLNFVLQLSTGLNGHIQVSTNLTSWTTLTNFVGTNSTLIFHDSAATNYSRRFYQAVIP
jgi:hypothetical protein